MSDISTAIESQLHSDLQLYEYFSVAVDESCDNLPMSKLTAIATGGPLAMIESVDRIVKLYKANQNILGFAISTALSAGNNSCLNH